jgi:L-amino acid N-acyltransferase YncA
MTTRLLTAGPQHVAALQALILTHGPNPWNWLPPDGVQQHMQDIADGHAHAVLAFEGEELLGAVTFCETQRFSRYQPTGQTNRAQGYICEAVVHGGHSGKGLGSLLLRSAVEQLKTLGMQEVYIDRHEENAASAGMMRKAGFEVVDTFAEPARRPHGSGRTRRCAGSA